MGYLKLSAKCLYNVCINLIVIISKVWNWILVRGALELVIFHVLPLTNDSWTFRNNILSSIFWSLWYQKSTLMYVWLWGMPLVVFNLMGRFRPQYCKIFDVAIIVFLSKCFNRIPHLRARNTLLTDANIKLMFADVLCSIFILLHSYNRVLALSTMWNSCCNAAIHCQ